jgi:hypothetical protein
MNETRWREKDHVARRVLKAEIPRFALCEAIEPRSDPLLTSLQFSLLHLAKTRLEVNPALQIDIKLKLEGILFGS